jgi:hypothetical protein
MNFRTTPKFTYLIGAGASAYALPLAKRINDSTSFDLATSMRMLRSTISQDILGQFDVKEKMDEIFHDIESLSKESESFGTIDTLAKYYFITNKEKYHTLKNTLSTYFTIEQLINKKLDTRYLAFITSICDVAIFPQNVNVISWNYDFQFQLAYYKLFGKERLSRSSKGVTVSNNNGLSYYPTSGNYFSTTAINHDTGFNLIQLNGIAGFNVFSEDHWAENIFLSNINNDADLFLNTIRFKSNNMLSFAWERHDSNHPLSKRLEIARHVVSKSDYLIVIGYSFPFFNRNVDREIFDAILQSSNLKKIYFQDPYSNGEYLKSQFNLPENILIEPIKKDQFHIPYEF